MPDTDTPTTDYKTLTQDEIDIDYSTFTENDIKHLLRFHLKDLNGHEAMLVLRFHHEKLSQSEIGMLLKHGCEHYPHHAMNLGFDLQVMLGTAPS